MCVTSQFSSAEWPAPFLTSLWESRCEWRGWIELANHGNSFQDQFNALQSTWRVTFQALYSILVKGRPFSAGFEVFSSSHYLRQVFSIGLPVIILYREQFLLCWSTISMKFECLHSMTKIQPSSLHFLRDIIVNSISSSGTVATTAAPHRHGLYVKIASALIQFPKPITKYRSCPTDTTSELG